MGMRRGTLRRRASGGGAKTRGPVKAEAGRAAACLSDVGRSRDHNEDRFGEDAGLGLWVVADGMGGHDAGEVASELAVSHVLRLVGEGGPLAAAVSTTHDLIRRAPSEGVGNAGMGTTVVAAQLAGASYRVCWVGDSRAYVHGPAGLQRITVDHTYVQQLLDSGSITPEEARAHPERNIVTQCLGADEHPAVEVGEAVGELHRGEVLLLCTDGLTGEVEEADIEAVLREEIPMAEKARRLVDRANAAGGSDNITVALIPAPPGARPKPAVTRTREIHAIGTGEAGKRRRAARWTAATACVAAVLAAGWYWRERVVEIVPVLLRHARELRPGVETGPAGAGAASSSGSEAVTSASGPGAASSWSFEALRNEMAGGGGGDGRGNDPARGRGFPATAGNEGADRGGGREDEPVPGRAFSGTAREATGRPVAVQDGAGATGEPRMRIGEELGSSPPASRAREEAPADGEGPGAPESATGREGAPADGEGPGAPESATAREEAADGEGPGAPESATAREEAADGEGPGAPESATGREGAPADGEGPGAPESATAREGAPADGEGPGAPEAATSPAAGPGASTAQRRD